MSHDGRFTGARALLVVGAAAVAAWLWIGRTTPVREPQPNVVSGKLTEKVTDKPADKLAVKPAERVAEKVADKAAAPDGVALYRTNCASCHGDTGDGNGIAARFLYPKPRDFTSAEFRVLSTTNLAPTEADILQVITRGMPGSAMVPFAHLSEAERVALTRQVLTLTRDGLFRRAVAEAKDRGDAPDEPQIREDIAAQMTPGPKVEIPKDWPAADAASLGRGRDIYKANCANCHGETGKGDGAQDQVDSMGVPIRPRDFGRGIFKGGREREQLYARIVLGMKGTPMPATKLDPAQVADLINYIHSLSPVDALARVEHRRVVLSAKRMTTLPDQLPAGGETNLVVSPLWWTDRPDADLRVSAAHDGKTLAVRLSWADPSRNDSIRRTEDFEDMASVQLFDRQPEPFLGMGAPGATPDLWLWRATWDRPRDFSDSKLDEYPLGGDQPPFLTARTAGNAHARLDEAQTASNLGAKGPGSVTFLPKASQSVSAKAQWADGRWSVEFRRPLAVPADAGITLKPGQAASVAFALWDGAAKDRNGQKQISIWHDLRLE